MIAGGQLLRVIFAVPTLAVLRIFFDSCGLASRKRLSLHLVHFAGLRAVGEPPALPKGMPYPAHHQPQAPVLEPLGQDNLAVR